MKAQRGEVRVSCSRWEELCDAILFHGTLAARLRAPTRFRLLNPPSNGAPQSCEVGYDADKKWLDRGHESIRMEGTEVVHDVDSASAEMEIVRLRAASVFYGGLPTSLRTTQVRLRELLASGPAGMTPLCAAVRDVVDSIRATAADLRRRGRRACVVIASDGAATDGDVETALRPLRDLPAWVIVRLCTQRSESRPVAFLRAPRRPSIPTLQKLYEFGRARRYGRGARRFLLVADRRRSGARHGRFGRPHG